jgi:type IV pilus assembly protein PilQ
MLRFPLFRSAGLGVAVTLAILASPRVDAARVNTATLRTVASRLDARTGIIAIEASAPVAYVASQPDARTFVVELRDVVATGFADRVALDSRHPVGGVDVESVQAADGTDVARVRLRLSQPVRPRVRSARNMIYVEADRADASATVAGAISSAGPASVIHAVRVSERGAATAVTFQGTDRLMATSVDEQEEGSKRLVITFPNVTSALAATTPIRRGPVERVRVGLDPRTPLATRVTMDLSRSAPYRVEGSRDGHEFTVVFDEPAADPIAALRNTPAARVVAATPDATPSAPAVAAVEAAVAAAPAVVPPARPPVVPAAAKPETTAPAPVAAVQQTSAAQQAPAPAGAAQPATPAASRFTGSPVSLDMQGADLRAVLRTFAEISSLIVVIDPSMQGTVDVALRDVPWDQALDIILRANKLGYVVDGTIVRVAPLTVLAEEEVQRRKLAEEQALAGELRVMTRSLSYSKPEDLQKLLTATVLSQRGSIQTDPRTNTLIINDLQDRLDRAAALLTTLDRPEPQVEIEARIVQTTREFARRLGVQWGGAGRASTALGNTLPLAFPNQLGVTGRTGAVQGAPLPDPGTDAVGSAVNLGVLGATSGIGLALGSVNGAVNLDVALSAIEESGQGRILSTPRVSTQNNIEAEITQGIQIPIQTIANNTVTVQFRDAALTLKVTPQITAANTVIMRIALENAAPDFSRSVNNIPPIDTQRANTQVLVSDGETTVIGGIYVSREQASQDRTPGLHRLPLLGWLFKRDELSDESRELLIFITPKISRL